MRDYYELFQYLCYEILINKLYFVVIHYIYFNTCHSFEKAEGKRKKGYIYLMLRILLDVSQCCPTHLSPLIL